jgi:hypothetical protein
MNTWKIISASALSICFLVNAADSDGNFAAKGAARQDCQDYSASAAAKNSDFLLYSGWVEGYISAYNQFAPDNYDLLPWQTTELFMLLLARHCEAHPNAKFFDAANSLIKAFYPIRLTAKNTVVAVTTNQRTLYMYEEILSRAQARLSNMGFYTNPPVRARFSEADSKALVAFQTAAGLSVTGTFDQETLTALFLKPVSVKANKAP